MGYDTGALMVTSQSEPHKEHPFYLVFAHGESYTSPFEWTKTETRPLHICLSSPLLFSPSSHFLHLHFLFPDSHPLFVLTNAQFCNFLCHLSLLFCSFPSPLGRGRVRSCVCVCVCFVSLCNASIVVNESHEGNLSHL